MKADRKMLSLLLDSFLCSIILPSHRLIFKLLGGDILATRNEMLLAGILMATIIASAVVVTLLIYGQPVSSTGKIRAIGCDIWADTNRTIKLQQIDWGVLSPGDIAGITFWIQNIGNVNGTLSFNVTDWKFATVTPNSTLPGNASSYLVLSWNYSGAVMKPFETVPVQMQLAVSPQIANISQFNCTINIWIREYK